MPIQSWPRPLPAWRSPGAEASRDSSMLMQCSCYPYAYLFVGVLEQDSAIDAQGGAGDIVGIVRSEERSGLADVFRCTKAAPGEGRAGLCHQLVAKRFMLTWRVDPAWLDDVDVDSMRIELG